MPYSTIRFTVCLARHRKPYRGGFRIAPCFRPLRGAGRLIGVCDQCFEHKSRPDDVLCDSKGRRISLARARALIMTRHGDASLTVLSVPPQPPRGFRHVPNFPGYAVNRNGDVQSCRPVGSASRGMFMEQWHALKLLYLKPAVPTKPTYAHVQMVSPATGKYRPYRVHHLVLWAFVGPCPPGMEGCHKNGKSKDNRLSNLRWGTSLSNSADQIRHGKVSHGERHAFAKLTERRVRYILASRESDAKLAKRFGVSNSVVSDVRNNVSWKHIERRNRR